MSATDKRDAPATLRQALLASMPIYKRVLAYSLVINVLVLAPTFFMLQVYERVINSRNATTLAMLLLLVIGVFLVMELLDLVRGVLMQRAGQRLEAALRERLFDVALAGKLQRSEAPSTLAFADLKLLREAMSSPALMALLDTPMALTFLVLIFIISPWLGVLACLGAVLQLLIVWRTQRMTLPLQAQAGQAQAQAQGYAAGVLRNAQVAMALGMQSSLHRQWLALQQRYLRTQAQASDHASLNLAVSNGVQVLMGSLLLGAACWLSLKGMLLGGEVMMIVASMLGVRVLAPLGQLVLQWQTLVQSLDAYGRLDGLLGTAVKRRAAMALPAPSGQLAVEGLTAAAPGSQLAILRNLNFALGPGQLLVVAGPSASGKSTLARLLVGVWPAMSGKVRLDGVDVFAWNKDELGAHVGYLPQEIELFDGSIADNIARFGSVDMNEVSKAAERVGLASWVQELPQGYETRIGEEGAFLSGGQRQRIALARAIYGMPRLLVLDEPNASLDAAGDQAFIALLGMLKAAGSTVVVISHRVNVLAVADRMLLLRDGQLVAFGPYDQVINAMRQRVGSGSGAKV